MHPGNPLANLTLDMFKLEKNCTAVGAFAAYHSGFQNNYYFPTEDIKVRIVRESILFCSDIAIADLRDGDISYSEKNTITIGNFTDDNAVDWYNQFNADTFIYWYQYELCSKEICPNLVFKGNADLAGIGVSAQPTPKTRYLNHTAG